MVLTRSQRNTFPHYERLPAEIRVEILKWALVGTTFDGEDSISVADRTTEVYANAKIWHNMHRHQVASDFLVDVDLKTLCKELDFAYGLCNVSKTLRYDLQLALRDYNSDYLLEHVESTLDSLSLAEERARKAMADLPTSPVYLFPIIQRRMNFWAERAKVLARVVKVVAQGKHAMELLRLRLLGMDRATALRVSLESPIRPEHAKLHPDRFMTFLSEEFFRRSMRQKVVIEFCDGPSREVRSQWPIPSCGHFSELALILGRDFWGNKRPP